jgi:hypothetical protein
MRCALLLAADVVLLRGAVVTGPVHFFRLSLRARLGQFGVYFRRTLLFREFLCHRTLTTACRLTEIQPSLSVSTPGYLLM